MLMWKHAHHSLGSLFAKTFRSRFLTLPLGHSIVVIFVLFVIISSFHNDISPSIACVRSIMSAIFISTEVPLLFINAVHPWHHTYFNFHYASFVGSLFFLMDYLESQKIWKEKDLIAVGRSVISFLYSIVRELFIHGAPSLKQALLSYNLLNMLTLLAFTVSSIVPFIHRCITILEFHHIIPLFSCLVFWCVF